MGLRVPAALAVGISLIVLPVIIVRAQAEGEAPPATETVAEPAPQEAETAAPSQEGSVLGAEPLRRDSTCAWSHLAAAEGLHRVVESAQACAQQSACDGLGHRQRQTLAAQQVEDDGLHGLVVDAEDDIAKEHADQSLFGIEDALCRGLVVALGYDAHLDAVDAARLEGERRVAEAIQLVDAGCQDLRKARFAHAPRAQHP